MLTNPNKLSALSFDYDVSLVNITGNQTQTSQIVGPFLLPKQSNNNLNREKKLYILTKKQETVVVNPQLAGCTISIREGNTY